MKNILILSASPRKNGNSDTLCDSFMEGAKTAGNNVKKIFIKDKKINYCTGCGFCNTNNYTKCSQADDMENILNEMINADIIVMASPVYFYTINAQMKTLIDRCCAKYTRIINKDFYFIATAADTNNKMLDRTFECFKGFTDCLTGATVKGCLYASGVWNKDEVKSTRYLKEAYNMGFNA